MLCEKCGKREATTHIKKIINGDFSEHHFCSECAQEQGYDPFSDGIASEINNMLGGFLGMGVNTLAGTKRCPMCGSSYNDIINSSMVGCENCYKTFYRELLPTIKRIHGNTSHCGRKPAQQAETRESRIENLKKQLSDAVAAQEFEKAAQLRDKIKEEENNA